MKLFYVNDEGKQITIDTDDTPVYVLCYECGGEGTQEVSDCINPSSECCGGCTRDISCSECDGSKMTDITDLI